MYGCSWFKHVFGKFKRLGVLGTSQLPIPQGAFIPRGTHVDYSSSDRTQMVLASGNAIGYTTMDIDNDGLSGLQGFQDFTLGRLDRKAKKGGENVSVQMTELDGLIEFEGLGGAGVGNLVATTGTGAISNATAKKTELSVIMGSLRVAQSGDVVLYHMENAAVTPETQGNVRILVKRVGNYIKA